MMNRNSKQQALWIARLAGGGILVALAAAIAAAQAPTREQEQAERAAQIAAGKQLFERKWEVGKPERPGSDGLGPMFNHNSCAACHLQGGTGGGGPIDVNAVMLSVIPPEFKSDAQKREFLVALQAVHPAFVTDKGQLVPNVILHRFGTDPKYAALRAKLAGKDLPLKPSGSELTQAQEKMATGPVQWVSAVRPLPVAITQRNAPAMFGGGLIDAIPDATIRAIAAAQNGHKEVSGRVAPVNLSKVGRFGWRGQTEHLEDFVLGACANELGLEVPQNSQPMDPLRPEYRAPSLDLSQLACNQLVAFVAALPPPRFVKPVDADKLAAVDRGYTMFHQIGCSTCHVENVLPAKSVFSDLLLHDMGPALGDPVVAQPTQVPVEVNSSSRQEVVKKQLSEKPAEVSVGRQTYYGGLGPPAVNGMTFVSETGEVTSFRIMPRGGVAEIKFGPAPTNLAQEWKTPPLWGVADSAPYLHDGRAATLLEAIVLHGGEAKACTERFLALPAGDRMAILEFLGCLKGPDPEAPLVAAR